MVSAQGNHTGITGLWVSSANKTVIFFAAFLLAASVPVCWGESLLSYWVQKKTRVKAGMHLIIFSDLTSPWIFSSSFSPLKVNAGKPEVCGGVSEKFRHCQDNDRLIRVFGQDLILSDLFLCISDMSQHLIVSTSLPQPLQ